MFAIEDDGLRHEETTQIAGIKDAAMARNGDYVYAVYLDASSRVRTYQRDQETGLLTPEGLIRRWTDVRDLDTLGNRG